MMAVLEHDASARLMLFSIKSLRWSSLASVIGDLLRATAGVWDWSRLPWLMASAKKEEEMAEEKGSGTFVTPEA